MNIVFLIGNGFDLNLGLHTRFTDFYNYYNEWRAADQRPYIQTFLGEIGNDSEDWSNFEISFGGYAQNFSKESCSDYLEIWADVHSMLADYINTQQEKVISAKSRPNYNACRYLMFPDHFLARGARLPFDELRTRLGGPINIDIINFNYTSTFEKLYGWRNVPETIYDGSNRHAYLNSITHIHGTTEENMILGVDNLSQIICHDDIANMDKVKYRLIKPIANKNTQTLRDEDCTKRIAKANIICVFGMSLGETDQTWWRLIGERLKSPDALAIIFSRNKDMPANVGYLAVESRDRKIKEFLRAAGNADDRVSALTDKISVDFNSKIFSDFANIVS